MRFKSFKFKNFRGIKSAELNLSKNANTHINVLVGLNESGKTTVLEAIHHFLSNPNLLKKTPISGNRSKAEYQSMLPIGERHFFNGNIEIEATIEIENEDWKKIEDFLLTNFGLHRSTRIKQFTISHRVVFSDSNFKSITNQWSTVFQGYKGARAKKITELHKGDWLAVANFVEKLLPKIVYFPSSLFEFPEKIVLETTAALQEPRNDFYCGVLEDILRAINPSLKLQDHLIDRVKSNDPLQMENVEALLTKVGAHLKKTILEEWKSISNEPIDEINFRVTLNKNGPLSLEIKIVTPDGNFSINEKSAGFRWFFAYILLTRYRLHRKDRVLFLFDEPAANLHPNAQSLLLKSFSFLAQEADIIYSTHSHYLINPLWLEFTHVVKNSSSGELAGLMIGNPTKNSIKIIPYRTFVGNHPEQYFYYKPIHDALDYSPSPIEFPNNVVLVEGKSDFFALKYFLQEVIQADVGLQIFPGGGAGSLDPLISMLHGWGKNYIILLDSDEAGEKQKKRYRDKFETIVNDRIFSFSDIFETEKNQKIETMFSTQDMEKIRLEMFPETAKLSKKNLHLAMQELIATRKRLDFGSETKNNFRKVFTFLTDKLFSGLF